MKGQPGKILPQPELAPDQSLRQLHLHHRRLSARQLPHHLAAFRGTLCQRSGTASVQRKREWKQEAHQLRHRGCRPCSFHSQRATVGCGCRGRRAVCSRLPHGQVQSAGEWDRESLISCQWLRSLPLVTVRAVSEQQRQGCRHLAEVAGGGCACINTVTCC